MFTYPTLYKRDQNGNIREWHIEQDGSRYRVVSGVQNGQKVTSEWKQAVSKGIGKASTTPEEQAVFEIRSNYKGKTDRTYHEKIEDVDKPIKFDPMLAASYESWEKLPQGQKFAQPKLDGVRCILTADKMMSRGGKPIAGAEHILESLQWFFDRFPDAELDGELYNHSFKDNFDTLISYIKKKRPESREFVQYHIYDVPSHPGTFSERWQFILNEIEQYLDNEPIVIVETHYVSSKEALDVYYDLFLDEGYEGQMIRLDTVYENKRTKALLKRKEFKDDEFPLVSINEGIGNWSGMAKSVTFRLPDGRTANAGIKGNQAEMLALLHATQYERVTIKYQNLTPGGVPRFPVAIKFWDAEALATGDRDG